MLSNGNQSKQRTKTKNQQRADGAAQACQTYRHRTPQLRHEDTFSGIVATTAATALHYGRDGCASRQVDRVAGCGRMSCRARRGCASASIYVRHLDAEAVSDMCQIHSGGQLLGLPGFLPS